MKTEIISNYSVDGGEAYKVAQNDAAKYEALIEVAKIIAKRNLHSYVELELDTVFISLEDNALAQTEIINDFVFILQLAKKHLMKAAKNGEYLPHSIIDAKTTLSAYNDDDLYKGI